MLSRPLAERAPELVRSSLRDPLVGSELGAYRVGEEIGRGGMGIVYRAERADGAFDQKVVIKVLRKSVDDVSARERFALERNILARLRHPSIATLLDGGITPDGLPYTVLEEVHGRPIDEFCSQLDQRAIVELFVKVCDVVDAAHSRLVVHRDLKPSNVLVQEDGSPKLLDFGIAKILDDEDEDLTRTGHLLLTPHYASPEQLQGESITTASDQYQLAALLYELLTGRLPHRIDQPSALQLARTICEVEPEAPSRVAPPQKARSLRGDLDRILLMALRKAPDRRYSSVRAFRDDLARHLRGEAVSARGDSLAYRANVTIRRRWPILSAAAVVVAAGIGFGLYHLSSIRNERDLAQAEAARRAEITELLVDLLRVGDSAQGEGEFSPVELVRQAMRRIDEEISDDAVRAELLGSVGRIASNLGVDEEATEALSHSFELHQERVPGLDEKGRELGFLYMDHLLSRRQFDRASPIAEELLEATKPGSGVPPRVHARALTMLSTIRRGTGEPDEAEALCRDAIAAYESDPDSDPKALLAVRATLAYTLRGQGRLDEAKTIYDEVLPQLRAGPDSERETLANAVNNYAFIVNAEGGHDEAVELYREAIGYREEAAGAAHPATINMRGNLMGALVAAGRFDEAASVARENIRLSNELNGREHWRTASTYESLASVEERRDGFEEAIVAMSEACKIFAASLGDDHQWTISAQARLALFEILAEADDGADQRLVEYLSRIDPEVAATNIGVSGRLERMATVCEERGWSDRATRIRALLPESGD